MSYAEIKGFKDHFSYMDSILRVKADDASLYGETVNVYDEDNNLVASGTLNALTGHCDIITDCSGRLKVTATDGEETATTYVLVSSYATYNVNLSFTWQYGFEVNPNDSNPATAVRALEDCDNANYESAYMDFTTGVFHYGDWADAPFMPRPCMLKYDGTVDYYLDPDDYTKKADGTASDVANTSFGGNAMMEWDTIYTYHEPAANGRFITRVSNKKLGSSWEAWSFHKRNGDIAEHTYMPIYDGSLIDGKLRSISGQAPENGHTTAQQRSYAQANGTGWDIDVLADRLLVNSLLTLMSINLNGQEAYGKGYITGGSSAASLRGSGSLNTKGLFWGANDETTSVKVFGMENYWGNIWKRCLGLINASGTQKIKMCYGREDGSTVDGYNDSGSGYITVGNATPGGTNGGYISAMTMTSFGPFAKTASGSATTYWCDGLWFNNSQTNVALFGGNCNDGMHCGPFCVYLSAPSGFTYWDFGARPSFKS